MREDERIWKNMEAPANDERLNITSIQYFASYYAV